MIITSPTSVNGKDYYWINSIFTHTPAKLSENKWILDLIKDETPFFKRFDSINLSLKINNAFIIVDNINIENNIRVAFGALKEYSVKMKLLNGVIYVYDDNYYFLTRGSFSKYKNKKSMIEKLKNVIDKIKPSCIIDLSIINSNYFKPEHIFHMTSCVIHNDFKNYKYNNEFPNYIECAYIYKKTKYLIRDTITINNYTNSNNKKLNNLITSNTSNISEESNVNKIFTGPESIYITFLLSNYFSIPCVTLGVTYDEQSDLSNSNKQLKKVSDKIINTMFSLF
jgi:translation elongation factor P/translation initiation factor 5A